MNSTDPVFASRDPLDVEHFLQRLPDLPRWVEARGALLDGGELFGATGGEPLSGVVLHRDWALAAAIGRPAASAIVEAADAAEEVIASADNYRHVAAALPDWIGEMATIHILGRELPKQADPDPTVRALDPEEVPHLDHLPDTLRSELADAAEAGIPITAALADGLPVAFCYPGALTESLWDVSIDTVPSHRRQGYAARCFIATARLLAAAGKAAVWGSYESNFASRRLAEKLGFEAVDSVVVFRRN